jgi:hypothetical protein
MNGHRTYLGAGSIRRTAHITAKKGHRTFITPIKPKESELVRQAA